MWFKKLHMFFQSFMKCSICKDLTASSMLPNSHNVMSTEIPPLTRCTNASPLLEVHGGWMAKLKWCINMPLIFLSQFYMGTCFFWLWQGNLLLLIFRVFVVVVYRWNLLRGSIFGWSEKCHQEQTEMMEKVTVRKLLPKLIRGKNSQNPR